LARPEPPEGGTPSQRGPESRDNLNAAEIVIEALAAAEKKARLPVSSMLLGGFMSGAYLGFAASVSYTAVAQGLPPVVGAILFPMGFVMLVLLGHELVTGNFALLPMGVAAGRIGWPALARNWVWVYAGNLAGGLAYAALFWVALTTAGTTDAGPVGQVVAALAAKKTLHYAAAHATGWTAAFIKGVLANWMVTVGTVLAFSARSTLGKIAAMWLPITIFFALGYEHCVVNMFAVPAGMFFGAPITLADWWAWNQAPSTLGNIVGGALFTGLPLYYGHRRKHDRHT